MFYRIRVIEDITLILTYAQQSLNNLPVTTYMSQILQLSQLYVFFLSGPNTKGNGRMSALVPVTPSANAICTREPMCK